MATDGESFSDDEARAAWDTGAEAWEAFVESGADYYRHEVHGPALLTACEPVARLTALDLGCGQGFFSRQLAGRGAHVTGLDISEEQLAHALAHEAREPLGIEYVRASASEIGQLWPPDSFDLVTACMSLHDMADPGKALSSAHRVLRSTGRLVFSIPHPCTDTPYREWERDAAGNKGPLKVDRYFDTGPATNHWNMRRLVYYWDTPHWRHTIAEWSEMIEAAGFLIRRLHEPRATVEQIARNLHIEDAGRLPTFLIFDLVKPG